jgi:predicted dithiol-disulfide oxidoreductase (DUF899 family)
MYHADEDRFCDGCSMVVDNMGHRAQLHAVANGSAPESIAAISQQW